jgi:sucrose phosphorylase
MIPQEFGDSVARGNSELAADHKEMSRAAIAELLDFMYGNAAGGLLPRLIELLEQHGVCDAETPCIANTDAFLIAYGDMLSSAGGNSTETALARLDRFMNEWNRGDFSYLHLLPFHPYSSDDGFSVIDYRQVDPRQGTWEDIAALANKYKLTFDFVINHGSVKSEWFTQFLAAQGIYKNRYLTRPSGYDSSMVVRPRTHPLFTEFTKTDGTPAQVWTTFSSDQADYDFSDPETLLEFIRLFLEYSGRGGRMLRLDAIAYVWKEDGTPCIHHPKTHALVRLLRAITQYLKLPMLLLTETNVPHRENLSYFGGNFSLANDCPGAGEAHLVYNFALPPLALHAAISGDAGPLRKWARELPVLPPGNYFLNFLASHDGVGLTPAQGLIDEADFAKTLEIAAERGALISMKSTPQGNIPYELNCNWADMTAPVNLGNPTDQARAFLTSYAAALSLPGLPAVYFHSWIGSRAWTDGPALAGYKRAINREKPAIEIVEQEIRRPGSFRSLVMRGFHDLFEFRSRYKEFNPHSHCAVLETGAQGVCALIRECPGAGQKVAAIHNFSSHRESVDIPALGNIQVCAHGVRWIAYDHSGIVRELAL